MDIREALLADRSKEHIQYIANYIGNDQERFNQLFDLFLHDEIRVTQRAAWVISHCFDKHPQLIDLHIKAFWTNLEVPQNDAIKRNTLRIFQNYSLPEELQGIAATLCFDFLADPNEAVAIRAHSMPILYNIGLQQPELLPELALLLEEVIPHGSTGLKNRGMKILKKIRKQIGNNY